MHGTTSLKITAHLTIHNTNSNQQQRNKYTLHYNRKLNYNHNNRYIIYIYIYIQPNNRNNNKNIGTDTNWKVAGSIQAGVSGFFIGIKSFRSHYGPEVDSNSNRNEYQEHFLGVKEAGAQG